MNNSLISFFSKCTNPIVEKAVKTAEEEIGDDKDISITLSSLTREIDQVELASVNLFQLDKAIKVVIKKQAETITNTGNADSRDDVCINVTTSVIELNDKVLGSLDAFLGLPSNLRHEVLDNVQKNVNATLNLLAGCLLEEIYEKEAHNLCNLQRVFDECYFDFNSHCYFW